MKKPLVDIPIAVEDTKKIKKRLDRFFAAIRKSDTSFV